MYVMIRCLLITPPAEEKAFVTCIGGFPSPTICGNEAPVHISGNLTTVSALQSLYLTASTNHPLTIQSVSNTFCECVGTLWLWGYLCHTRRQPHVILQTSDHLLLYRMWHQGIYQR